MEITIRIFSLFTLINLIITEDILYTPFQKDDSGIINTIFGTGNRLKDISFRAYCATKCGSGTYNDEQCCQGNRINELKCLSKTECKNLVNEFRSYVVEIVLITYFTLLIATAMIVTIVSYIMTKKENFKIKNAIAACIIVFCCGLIIPIIIIEIYCCVQNKKWGDIFGADFDACGINNLMQSVEVKDYRRQPRQIEEKSGTQGIELGEEVKSLEEKSEKKGLKSTRGGNIKFK